MKVFSKILALATLTLSLSSANAQLEGNVLAIGDSLTAGLARSSSRQITCASLGGAVIANNRQRTCVGGGQRNVGGWQPALSQALELDVFNYGNSGEVTSEMLARLSSHMASTSSQFVLILGGTNDALFGVPQAQTIANLKAMIELVRGAGREPIIGTLPPLGSVFVSRNANIISINAEIRAFDNIQVADHYALLVDNWAQSTSGDFIHLGTQGNSIVAQEWQRAIRASVEPRSAAVAPVINLLLSNDG